MEVMRTVTGPFEQEIGDVGAVDDEMMYGARRHHHYGSNSVAEIRGGVNSEMDGQRVRRLRRGHAVSGNTSVTNKNTANVFESEPTTSLCDDHMVSHGQANGAIRDRGERGQERD